MVGERYREPHDDWPALPDVTAPFCPRLGAEDRSTAAPEDLGGVVPVDGWSPHGGTRGLVAGLLGQMLDFDAIHHYTLMYTSDSTSFSPSPLR